MSTPTIQLSQVTKQFGQGHTLVTALKTVNFTAHQGEFISVIGPSGSGKSTFLTIAGGLQTPTTGTVTLNGQSLGTLSAKQRLADRFEHIGFILQGSNLIPFLSVADQLALVDKTAGRPVDHAKIAQRLSQLGVAELAHQFPDELSGGERQRVAIARALYNDPSVILADEPTASLDTARSIDVVQTLVNLAHEQKVTIIMVTHDDQLIGDSDQIYRIIDGQMTLA